MIDPSGNLAIGGLLGRVGLLATTKVGRTFLLQSFKSSAKTALSPKTVGVLAIVGAAGAGGIKLLNLIDVKNDDDDNDDKLTVYHGTSARRAFSISETGFRSSKDGVIYFTDDEASALEWAGDISYRRPPGETLPTRLGVIRFDVPMNLAQTLGLNVSYPIGTCRGTTQITLDTGSSSERCMFGEGARLEFNGALLLNVIESEVTKY